MSRPEYLQIRLDPIRRQLDAICERLGLDPNSRGAYTQAVTYTVYTVYEHNDSRRGIQPPAEGE